MIRPNDTAGRGARTPFQVPAEGWLAVLKRTWAETGEDNIGLIAAGVAFYAFAAIVPLLAAVVLSYGLFAAPETVQHNVEAVFSTLPREAASIASDQLLSVVRSSQDKKGLGLLIALVLAFYGATKGASAIVTGLNVAYDTRETRGIVRVNLLYFAIVAGGVLLIFLAMLATALIGFIEGLLPGAPGVVILLVRLAGYVVLAALVMTAASALFYVGPAKEQPRWLWLSPGSASATAAWLAGTSAFGFYVANFGNYGATYGSLSAVVVLLTWLWLSAYVFLLGAELNTELERQVEGQAETLPDTPATTPAAAEVARGKMSQADDRPSNTAIFVFAGVVGAVGHLLLKRRAYVAFTVSTLAATVAWQGMRMPRTGWRQIRR